MPPADGAGSSNGGSDFDLEAQHRQTGSTGPQQQHVAAAAAAESHQQLRRVTDRTGAAGGGSGPGSLAAGPGSHSQTQHRAAIIPKVREQLRRAAGDYVFTPQIMLIGPYHEWKDYYSFPWMEKKKKAVDHLKRLMGDDRLEDLKTMLAQLWRQEVRRFYTHLASNDQEEDPAAFANLLLHDGCYLLSLFFEFEGQSQQQGGTPPGNSQGGSGDDEQQQIIDSIEDTLVRDIMYLLENQVPLFVLQKILDRIVPGHEALSRIASNVTTLLQTQLYISNRRWAVPSEASDLLHLVHSYFRQGRPGAVAQQPGCWPLDQGRPRVARQRRVLTGKWRRATDYSRYANLRFRPRVFSEDGARTILDIDLQGGTLWMPRCRVDSNTWTLLRNLMALEEQEEEQRPVTAYCLFMSQVACTAEDVELLQRAKVLEHFLGTDEQAAEGFAKLCDGVAFDIDKPERNYLRAMWHDLEERCRKPANHFMGFFRQRYWGNVFQRTVFFMVLILNICQMIQAIYALVAYYKPRQSR